MGCIDLPHQHHAGEPAPEPWAGPVKGHSGIRVFVLLLVGNLPAEEREHADGEEGPGELGERRAAEALQVVDPAPDDVGDSCQNTGDKGAESSRADREALGNIRVSLCRAWRTFEEENLLGRLVNSEVGGIPVEADEDREEKKHLLPPNQGPHLLHLSQHRFVLGRIRKPGAIRSDHLLRRRHQQRQRQTKALECNEDKVCRVRDLALLSVLGVERQLDGRTDELPQLTETKPDTS